MGDYSRQYTEHKKAYINLKFGNKSVQFKPFVDSVSFTVDRKQDEKKKNIYSDTNVTGPFKSARYSLSFTVLATNLNESIENHKDFQKLARMVCPHEDGMSENRVVSLKLANLVAGQSGMGFNGIIQKISYKPIMELGFFEDNGFIFAKGFAISVDIINEPNSEIKNVPYRRSSFYYGNTTRVVTKKTNEEKENEETINQVLDPGGTEEVQVGQFSDFSSDPPKEGSQEEDQNQKGSDNIPTGENKKDETPPDSGKFKVDGDYN